MTDHSGQYYLAERPGEGGMAVVYKASDTRLERDVAIKIIRRGAFPSDDLAEILKRKPIYMRCNFGQFSVRFEN